MAVLTGAVNSLATAEVAASGLSYRLIVRDFRFRNDDGSETGASWAATLNTNLPDIDQTLNYRVRFSIENVGLSAASASNYGHLEASEDGGTYKTIGMDAVTSPVVIPPHTLNNVSTITPAYTDESVDGDGRLFVDSNGIWHLAYFGYEAAAPTVKVIIVRTSITEGLSWRKHKFDIDGEEVLYITEDMNGTILVLTSSYLIRSTTSGLTWEDPVARPVVSGITIFNFFVNASNDYIIAEGYAMKYHVSSNEGTTWTTYQNNDFPAALGLADIYFELDDATSDLTVWYLGTTSNDDPVKMYRWIDTYPYTGFPNASEDDISQLLFTGDSGLANTFQGNAAIFVRSSSGMNAIMYSTGWGVEPPAAIVEITTDNFEFKTLDYISQNWDDTSVSDTSPQQVKTVRQGRAGSVLYTTFGAFGFSGNTFEFTPGFMGWYEYGNANVASVQYSPSVNKWYAVETLSSGTVECYELEWSQVPDGTHTTQQISSSSFTASNYGYTHHNMIRGSDGTAIPTGEKTEYEYAFRLRPSEDIAGKVVCLRPSGFGQYDNVACFTIPVGYAALTATAAINVAGDTDGPHSYPTVSATVVASGDALRTANVALSNAASISAAGMMLRLAATNLQNTAEMTGSAFVTKQAAVNMLVNTNLSIASINLKQVAISMAATAVSLISEPALLVPCRTNLTIAVSVTPTARKELHAAASLHNNSLLGIRGSVDEVCIDLVIYQEEQEFISVSSTTSVWDVVESIWDAGASVWDVVESLWDDGESEWDGGATEWDVEGEESIWDTTEVSEWDGGESEWDGGTVGGYADIPLIITQSKPLTITNIPARLTIKQAPEPDLVITQQLPLRVYI